MAAPVGEPVDRLLSRLERVQRRGADRWSARCPSHNDKGPSLSVRALPDGVVLLKCFSGCTAAEVLAAAGLSLSDLFPARPEHHRPAERRPWRDAGFDALAALVDEVNVTFVSAALMAGGLVLSAAELDRLTLAAERCNGALVLVRGGRNRG
jgi:hypothetical protein